MFRPLEGDQVVLSSQGKISVYPLYEWQGLLFAKVGSNSFVRLKADGRTSDNKNILHMETEQRLWKDAFGRLAVADAVGRKPVQLSFSPDDAGTTTMQIENQPDLKE